MRQCQLNNEQSISTPLAPDFSSVRTRPDSRSILCHCLTPSFLLLLIVTIMSLLPSAFILHTLAAPSPSSSPGTSLPSSLIRSLRWRGVVSRNFLPRHCDKPTALLTLLPLPKALKDSASQSQSSNQGQQQGGMAIMMEVEGAPVRQPRIVARLTVLSHQDDADSSSSYLMLHALTANELESLPASVHEPHSRNRPVPETLYRPVCLRWKSVDSDSVSDSSGMDGETQTAITAMLSTALVGNDEGDGEGDVTVHVPLACTRASFTLNHAAHAATCPKSSEPQSTSSSASSDASHRSDEAEPSSASPPPPFDPLFDVRSFFTLPSHLASAEDETKPFLTIIALRPANDADSEADWVVPLLVFLLQLVFFCCLALLYMYSRGRLRSYERLRFLGEEEERIRAEEEAKFGMGIDAALSEEGELESGGQYGERREEQHTYLIGGAGAGAAAGSRRMTNDEDQERETYRNQMATAAQGNERSRARGIQTVREEEEEYR